MALFVQPQLWGSKMKLRLILATLLVVGALATSVCRKPNTDTAQLEELPKDIAANLQRVSNNSDLLISMPPVATTTPAAPKPEAAAPGVKPPPPLPPCWSIQRYLVQVTYPVTVCSARPDLFEVLEAYDAVMSPGPRPPAKVKNYKLSSFQGQALTNSLSCQQRSGPWLATITKTLDCSLQGTCTMVIEGVPACPNCPFFLWQGQNCQSENRPQEVQFFDPLVELSMSRFPCNGVNNCSNADVKIRR
jgi:hypothetical protein